MHTPMHMRVHARAAGFTCQALEAASLKGRKLQVIVKIVDYEALLGSR